MIKILHSADWHPHAFGMIAGKLALDPETGLSLTLSDFTKSLDWIHRLTMKEEVDAVVLAGDIFDSAKPTTDELNAVFRFLKLTSDHIPTIVIAGNHDLAQSGAAAPAISPGQFLEGPRIITRPESLELRILGANFRFDCLPYPSRGRLLASAPTDILKTPEGINGAINQGLAAILRGFTLEHTVRDDYRVLLAHGSIDGAKINEQPRSLAHDVLIPFGDITRTYDLIALGHIHQPQQLGPNAFYSGSLLRQSFGEEKERKGVWIHTLNGRELSSVFHENPHARTYLTVPVRELGTTPFPFDREAVYRIKGAIEAPAWEALGELWRSWTAEIPYLQTDVEIIREDRARDKQINASMTPDDALDRTLEREGIVDPLLTHVREIHQSLTHEVNQ